MLCLAQRIRLLKTTAFGWPAIRCLVLAVLLCGGVQEIRTAAAQEKPVTRKPRGRPNSRIIAIETYVTWLDAETIILALRSFNKACRRWYCQVFANGGGAGNLNDGVLYRFCDQWL
jgi:hypothetical protein